MSTMETLGSSERAVAVPPARSSDGARLARLRDMTSTDLSRARREMWAWLRELTDRREHDRLPWLFSQGTAPESPDGDCEGIVLGLEGALWLDVVDRAVRLGQLLGGIGWTGKSFDARAGTGYNRLTASSRPAALVVMPRYRFQRIGGELVGFPFHHTVERSPVAPFGEVRSIRYDAPEHRNPLVLPRTRDELVELVPQVYLGRALVRERDGFHVVGYFALRFPREDRS